MAIAARGDLEQDVTLDRVRERLTMHSSGRLRKSDAEPGRRWNEVEL
jgi:hypothetical protein